MALKRGWRVVWEWFGRFAEDPRKLLLLDLGLGVSVAALAVIFALYASQTHNALCNFRANLQDTQDHAKANLAEFKAYVVDHPDAFGLDPAILSQSIRDRQRTIDARAQTLDSLDDLNC